jgi:hypothetical protein
VALPRWIARVPGADCNTPLIDHMGAAKRVVSVELDWLALVLVSPGAPARRVRGAAASDRARAAGMGPVAPARAAGQATVLAVAALPEKAWLTRESWLFLINRPSIVRFHTLRVPHCRTTCKFSTGTRLGREPLFELVVFPAAQDEPPPRFVPYRRVTLRRLPQSGAQPPSRRSFSLAER